MIHDAVLQACDGIGRRQGWGDREPEDVQVRLRDARVQGRRRPLMPYRAAGRVRQGADVAISRTRPPAAVLSKRISWPGTELQWGTLGGPEPLANSLARVRNFHLKDPEWEFRLGQHRRRRRTRRQDGQRSAGVEQLQPEAVFRSRRQADHVARLVRSAGAGAEQHHLLQQRVEDGRRASEDSIALFLLPGVLHCGGGPGPDTFDRMAAISKWVEQGKKPARIIASHLTDGKVDRTRPLCPFGQVAKYAGLGNTNDAANFSCVPEPTVATGR